MKVAEFLESHPKVKRVHYPGLKSDPGHAVASSQVRGFGGILGFSTKASSDLRKHVKLCSPWVSLGDVGTLINPYGRDPGRGIPANYYRMSIGIEDPDDIIADLSQALDKA
jgi:cystathionine beta-lyase/cystathionine gamma-synthase